MQFQVPQFIEVEDKIFGPLTAKQFFYILGGGSIIFILYVFFELWLVVILGAPVAALSGALAFLKINGQPFVKIMANALNYGIKNRTYIWKKREFKPEAQVAGRADKLIAPQLTKSRLQDLSWSLDVQEKIRR